jgi:hypothetical protein
VTGKTELDQTKLFEIAVQTVRLGVDRDAVEGREFRKQFRELGISLDHWLKHEAPSSKHQTPEKFQAPNSKPSPRFDYWSLMFGASLVLGAWDLELFLSSESTE